VLKTRLARSVFDILRCKPDKDANKDANEYKDRERLDASPTPLELRLAQEIEDLLLFRLGFVWQPAHRLVVSRRRSTKGREEGECADEPE
jgi:hypothetical protein